VTATDAAGRAAAGSDIDPSAGSVSSGFTGLTGFGGRESRLNVKRRFLAGQQPEHGRRHGLHRYLEEQRNKPGVNIMVIFFSRFPPILTK
jgi:hypothetical protein